MNPDALKRFSDALAQIETQIKALRDALELARTAQPLDISEEAVKRMVELITEQPEPVDRLARAARVYQAYRDRKEKKW